MCSSTLQSRSVVLGFFLSPFLNIGHIFAQDQSWGTVPESKDFWKIAVMIGVISFLSYLRTIGLISSGPAALCGLSSFKSFSTPLSEAVILPVTESLHWDPSGADCWGSLP